MKYLYLVMAAGAGFAYAGHTGNAALSVAVWVAVFGVGAFWYSKRKT